jgi:hypothetical protein
MALPTTGTSALLDIVSPFIPDLEIQRLVPRARGGRRAYWSSAQLLRTSLLLLLTPARSTNLLCALLPEQRSWRRFAHLPNFRRLPTPRQLHEFRGLLTPRVLREINAVLLRRILTTWPAGQPAVAIIDATDLPAATNEYKKSPELASPLTGPPWVDARSRRDEPVILSVIKSTPCVCGWPTIRRPGFSCP